MAQRARRTIERRHFLAAAGAGAVALPLVSSGCSRRSSKPAVRPPGVPLSRFGKESTAMEVTEGLDLSGRTALVTGATSGLGLETMRVLTLRGAHVIGTGRTLEKAKEACATVSGRTTPIGLELERFDSIVAGTNAIRALGMPIDMLICNAGIMALPKNEQVDGIEKHFVVNHLGHFVLVNRLLEQVKAAAQGRVVMVSSGYHTKAPPGGIEFDNLAGTRGYDPYRMYGQSKLANGLFALELSRRFVGTNATANTILPGVINTNLGRHMDWGTRILAQLIGWTFMKSVEAGAATQTYVATAPALAKVSGHWFDDCNPFVPEPGSHGDDTVLAAKLWTKSEELTARYLA